MDAPFFKDIVFDGASAPLRCVYYDAQDGIRLRMAHWQGTGKGCVLIANGRTEFIEKYAHIATRFQQLGYDVVTLDWRGQGLSYRFQGRENVGYTHDFLDYQRDICAVQMWIKSQGIAPIDTVISTSMGGAIILRAIQSGFAIKRAIFVAPMWQVILPNPIGLVWEAISRFAVKLGLRERSLNRLKGIEFSNNPYTSDAKCYAHRGWQYQTQPSLRVGPPSLHWLRHTLKETRWLRKNAKSDLPILVLLGGDEKIVNTVAIQHLLKRFKNTKLHHFSTGKHELLIEKSYIIEKIWKEIQIFIDQN